MNTISASCSYGMVESEMKRLGYTRSFTKTTIGRGDNRDKINVFLDCEGGNTVLLQDVPK